MTRTASRQILRLRGEAPAQFLQGLVTNDVARLDARRIVYAAMLTPQGKYLADFFVIADGADVLIDVDAALGEDLLKRLNMYRLRAPVTIAPDPCTVLCGTGARPEGALDDPRHPAMGWRLYGSGLSGDDGTDWDRLRVDHCIPETGIELIPGESFVLECGFDRLNGVDFRKGCYVGQEVTARMRHKTELRKGLVSVRVEGTAPVGSEITIDGKPAGRLFTQSDGRGIAYLRFDRAMRAEQPLQAGSARVIWSEANGPDTQAAAS